MPDRGLITAAIAKIHGNGDSDLKARSLTTVVLEDYSCAVPVFVQDRS